MKILNFEKARETSLLTSAATRRGGERAFTMVEIAFSMAIVAFALVAIMGVLPTGMTVQKDNREDTIINNDGLYWLELLRSGSRGVDHLTNFVEEIQVTNIDRSWRLLPIPDQLTGQLIVGILGTPKYTNASGDRPVVNGIMARVRAINGAANEVGTRTNDFVFRYLLETEVTPFETLPQDTNGFRYYELAEVPMQDPQVLTNAYGVLERNMATNLQNIRVTLRWPVFQQGTNWIAGNNKRTFRTVRNGYMAWDQHYNRKAFYVSPNSYSYVPFIE